jgi:erythritol kinase
MAQGATVCIDAGTTVIKAVVFDLDGRELAIARRDTAVLSPHRGWSEQDMDEVLRAVVDCVAEAVGRSPIPVTGMAVTAQGDGAWIVDRSGAPTGNAVLWNDARAVDVLERWQRDGVLDEAFRINGSLGNLGLPHAILASLREHEPERVEGAAYVVTCGSWIFGSLTGAWGLHPSEASAPWIDVRTGDYSDELFGLYGLEEMRPLIPPVLDGAELTAPLTHEQAERLGLAPGTPVTLAPYDVVATGAGGGSATPGSAFTILGTTLCTATLLEAADTTGTPSGLTLLGGAGQPVVRAFPTLAGTGVLEWMRRLLGVSSAADVTELALESAPGAHGVRVLPYFSPAGERAPFLDPAARGVIAGVSFEHDAGDLARATVEGLAHVIRDCVEAASERPTELVVSGGGAASDLWCQGIADVTGIRTVRVDGTEIGAKGALLYAEVARGSKPTLADAAAHLVTRARHFDPDPALRALFDERHEDFARTRDALAPRWTEWANAAEPR